MCPIRNYTVDLGLREFILAGIACSVTAAPLALAAKSLAGLTVQVFGIGLLRAAQRNRPLVGTCRRGLSGGRRRIRGIAEAGTRRLPIDPDARARRDLVGRLSETRAARQQGQHSDDRKDSTDFHCNLPLLNRIRRPARRITASGAPACLGNAHQRRNLPRKARKPWSCFVLVLRDEDRSRRAEQIGKADADGID
jgi:hypothetical protein